MNGSSHAAFMMIYRLLLLVGMTAAIHGLLPAQTQPPAGGADTLPSAPQSTTRWFVPYVGAYIRSPFGFALEVGARGGIEIVHNIVGVTAEFGFIAFAPADSAGDSPVFGAHAVRLEVTPIPFGFMERLILHVDKRFFGGARTTFGGLGYGFAYRGEMPEPKKFVPYFDCTFVTGKNSSIPVPFFGAGLLMTL